ncbi:MAG: sodium/proline symporter [Oligoflexales bacterium]
MHLSMIVSFVLCLLIMLVIGIASSRQAKQTSQDYLLASRKVPAWMAALSAVSTTCSGFMFIGLIGVTYLNGVSGYWIGLGLVLGQFIVWRTCFQAFREKSGKIKAQTIPQFLASFSSGESVVVRRVLALLLLVFLGTYAAAQLSAGSKALHVLFSWDYAVGAVLGALVVLLYCLAGGIRASIWTDAAQSLLMIFAICLQIGVCIWEIGGPLNLLAQLKSMDPSLATMQIGSKLNTFGFFFGWLAVGLGVLGQPHIMVRAMVVESSKAIRLTRRYFFSYYVVFIFLATTAGPCCRVLLPSIEAFDAELALPMLAQEYLPGFLVGLILAGIFAATMSTADSQIISCSAALSHDLFGGSLQKLKYAKLGTILMTGVSLIVALNANETVFALVIFSWCALASAMGPLMVIQSLSWPIRPATALIMIPSGIGVALVWRILGWSPFVSEALPGMMVPFLVYGLVEFVLFKASDPEQGIQSKI